MTQNQNETFNAMIWSRIPKSTCVSFSQLQLGVYDAVANFNIGRKASILIFKKINMIPGKYFLEGYRKISKVIIHIKIWQSWSNKEAQEN